MEFSLFWRAMVVGLAIAAPIGPIGVICMRRTLAEGALRGLLSGLGAATADALYGSMAAFGLTFVSALIINYQEWLRFAGGMFLCYQGIKTFYAHPREAYAPDRTTGLWGAYFSTLGLTLMNPMIILFFMGLFAGLGVVSAGRNYLSAGLLVLGVFLGSSLWWILLSAAMSRVKMRFNPRWLLLINKLSGSVIFIFGLAALFI